MSSSYPSVYTWALDAHLSVLVKSALLHSYISRCVCYYCFHSFFFFASSICCIYFQLNELRKVLNLFLLSCAHVYHMNYKQKLNLVVRTYLNRRMMFVELVCVLLVVVVVMMVVMLVVMPLPLMWHFYFQLEISECYTHYQCFYFPQFYRKLRCIHNQFCYAVLSMWWIHGNYNTSKKKEPTKKARRSIFEFVLMWKMFQNSMTSTMLLLYEYMNSA